MANGEVSVHTFFYDILHVVSQALLVPDIILLLLLIGYSLFSIGSVLVEYFTEHKHYEVVMPKFLAGLTDASEDLVVPVIEESGLLNRQKEALKTVYEYRSLPGDALVSLVKRLMHEEESHYDAIVSRNNMAAKVAPMLGLMGTLIPLGPGIQALGKADTAALSSSLLVAFDTTVAGLVTAAVCLVIGKVRSSWYDNYLSALDSAMATLLQKIEDSRADGVSQSSVPQSQFAVGQQPPAEQPMMTDQLLAEAQLGVQQPAQPTEPTASFDSAQPADDGYSLAYVGQDSSMPQTASDPAMTADEPMTTPSGMPINSSTNASSIFEPRKNPVDEMYSD